jgi:cysteine desulfurase
MNVPYTRAQGSVRFSLGRYNTEDDIDQTLAVLPGIIDKLVEMSPYDKELKTFSADRAGSNQA